MRSTDSPHPPVLRQPEVGERQADQRENADALVHPFALVHRRLDATRMECELGLRLRYPTVLEGLNEGLKP